MEGWNWTKSKLWYQKYLEFSPIREIKSMRTELKLQYIINFNWRMKLKQIKSYIIAIRARKTNYNVQGLKWILRKNSLTHVICVGRREKLRGEIQTTIDTSPNTIVLHAPRYMKENMPENHSRRLLVIFGHRSRAHAPFETAWARKQTTHNTTRQQ